jgi:Flp pilus assembly protein TadG
MKCFQPALSKLVPPSSGRRDEAGQALVETALTFPLLFLLFFGIIEFSLVVFSYNTISNAAREGARAGIISGRTDADIRAAARSRTTAVQCSGAGMTITPSRPSSDTVRVDIDCTVPMITQLMVQALGGAGSIPLHASATMHVE